MGVTLDRFHPVRDDAVVEEAEVVVSLGDQELVHFGRVDLAPHEERELSANLPRRVPLEHRPVRLEQEIRDACVDHPLVRSRVLRGLPVAGQVAPLAVDEDAAARFVDVGGAAHEPRVRLDLRLAAARHDDDLDAGAIAGLKRLGLSEGEVAVGVAEEAAPRAEQSSVEVGVDAAECHGRRTVVAMETP